MPPKSSNAQKQKPAIGSTLVVVSLLSILFGIFIHAKGIWINPYADPNELRVVTVPQLKKRLHIAQSWPGTDVFDKYGSHAWRFLLVLVAFFQDALETRQGQATVFILTSAIMPLAAFMVTEAIKDGRNPRLSVGKVILVTGLGQLMMVGAATPLVYIPSYAAARYSELRSGIVHPLPSAEPWKTVVAQICSALSIGTIFLTAFTPIKTEAFVINNIIFQFFPVLFVPLLFLPRKDSATSKPGSASARQNPRLNASASYQLISYLSVALYYFGFYWGGKELFIQVYSTLGLKGAGPYLLFWDTIGLIVSTISIVVIDSIVDEAKVKQGEKRVHAQRLFLEDVIVGLPGAVLFGPGWAGARYFQRREILAEQSRFGIKSN